MAKAIEQIPDASADWWKLSELERRWRCSRDTIARRIKSGSLKAMKGLGGWRVHKSAIEAFERDAKISSPVPRRSSVPDVLGIREAMASTNR